MVPDLDSLAEAYDEHTLKSIAAALRHLSEVKFFESAVRMNKQLLLDRFDLEESSQLAAKILETQQTNRVLLALDGLAHSFKKENDDA